jgi:DNA repair exonuclease SbcCD nuclease subunit
MSKMLFTADWHCHLWKECSQDAGADRLADGLNCVRQILAEAQRRNCPVVFGGDMKQTKGQWQVPVVLGLFELFREYHDVNVFAIPGNHDGTADGRSGLDVFSELSNITVIDKPTVGNAPSGGMFAYWPWQPTLDGLPAFLAEAKRVKARVLIAHAFLSGATVGPDYVVPKVGATLEQFGLVGKGRVFDLALMGDIHSQQILGGGSDEALIIYPGSPYSQNWGDRELTKGAIYVEID